MRLDRDDIDAHDRDTEPSVDDDALVENSIKNLDLAAGRAGSLDNHAALSSYADREITPTPCKAVATRG